jgi:hypothetical protein
MSSPLITVTTAGLSFSWVGANDATWVVAWDSSLADAAISAYGAGTTARTTIGLVAGAGAAESAGTAGSAVSPCA